MTSNILCIYHDACAAAAVRATRRTMRIAGHVVPAANVPPSMASDAGHLLCQQFNVPPGGSCDPNSWFSATYYDGSDGRRHFSLRSPEGGADVGAVAKRIATMFNQAGQMGNAAAFRPYVGKTWTGGGHVHAAGFDAPLGWEGE